MNFYKLDNKSTDGDFLSGNPIQCKAVISIQDYNAGLIKEGDKIVIMLSNGRKYMGTVMSFTLSSNDTENDTKSFEGILKIIKHEPPLPIRK